MSISSAGSAPARIAVDAMGGDKAPDAVIEGVKEFLNLRKDCRIILVGVEPEMRRIAARVGLYSENVVFKNASEVIDMDETPAVAVRQKKDSSITVGTRIVKEGEADAFFSAGNTGAVMVASLLNLGRIEGVERPAIAAMMPTKTGVSVLLDVGANVNCTAEQLVQFAIMGNIYAEDILKITRPRVGILSIGEEESKGNEVSLKTLAMLKTVPFNFIGNIEGRDIINGNADVIVCDGFVGNVVLKFGEGLAEIIVSMLKEAMMKNVLTKLGALLISPGLKPFKKKLDYAEYGGAPLLGTDGITIISHGSSTPKAIMNAINVASKCFEQKVNEKIRKRIKAFKGEKIEKQAEAR